MRCSGLVWPQESVPRSPLKTRASTSADMLFSPSLLSDPLLDVADDLFERCAGAIEPGDAELQELWLVLVGDDAPARDDDVLPPVLLQQPLDQRKRGHVGAVEQGERDDVDVLIDRHPGDLLRRRE